MDVKVIVLVVVYGTENCSTRKSYNDIFDTTHVQGVVKRKQEATGSGCPTRNNKCHNCGNLGNLEAKVRKIDNVSYSTDQGKRRSHYSVNQFCLG